MDSQDKLWSFSWFRGFLDIFYRPSSVANYAPARTIQAISVALLLSAGSLTLLAYWYSISPELSEQSYTLQKQTLERTSAKFGWSEDFKADQLAELKSTFNFNAPATLASNLFRMLFGLFAFATLFWVGNRLFAPPQPTNFFSTLIIVAFSFSIDAAGTLITALLQTSFHSIIVAPSPGFLIDYSASPSIFAMLNRLNIFSIWQQIAIGIAVGSAAGMSRKMGIILGISVFGFILGFFGTMTFAFNG